MKKEKPFNDVKFGIMAGLLISAAFLGAALFVKNVESDAQIRSLANPVSPMAQRSCRPPKDQPRLCTAPEKPGETAGCPTSPDPATVKKDDDHLTKQLINGFFSPAAPGGIGGE